MISSTFAPDGNNNISVFKEEFVRLRSDVCCWSSASHRTKHLDCQRKLNTFSFTHFFVIQGSNCSIVLKKSLQNIFWDSYFYLYLIFDSRGADWRNKMNQRSSVLVQGRLLNSQTTFNILRRRRRRRNLLLNTTSRCLKRRQKLQKHLPPFILWRTAEKRSLPFSSRETFNR